MLTGLDLQSASSRRMLLDRQMMTSAEEIQKAYDELKEYVYIVNQPAEQLNIKTLQFRLQGLKDLRLTLNNLNENRLLDDIELFEIKHLAMLAEQVREQMTKMHLTCLLPDMKPIVKMLDPDGLNISTFYIYESYSETLKELRNRLKQEPQDEKTFVSMQEEEERIRKELTRRLHPYTETINKAFTILAQTDILLAKAIQIRDFNLCIPSIGNHTEYTDMWNPEVKSFVEAQGGEYQTNSISLYDNPTLLTGSNMGGKTVVLQTLTLCQYLFQFGFGIPANTATICQKDYIRLHISDNQSAEKGLSSFGAEMREIDEIIHLARTDSSLLALIDEPARTTNPVEGTALVNGLIETVVPTRQSIVIVTHYNVNADGCKCYRVKGLENGKMNYRLVQTGSQDVPHEALNIARELGIDTEWLQKTEKHLNN